MDASDSHISLPPTAVAAALGAVLGGEALGAAPALARLGAAPHLICHSGFLIGRLAQQAAATKSLLRSAREQKHFDVAELFAFVVPARMATPTPAGFARSLGVKLGYDDSETLKAVADDLLRRLTSPKSWTL